MTKAAKTGQRRKTAMKRNRPSGAVASQAMANLTAQDRKLLRLLKERTYLRTDQIHLLVYPERTMVRVGKHLWELSAERQLVACIHVWDGPRKWAVWFLDQLGYVACGELDTRTELVRLAAASRMVRHYLLVNEIWSHLRLSGYPHRWLDGLRYDTTEGELIPDAGVIAGDLHVALEADRSTERHGPLRDKLAKYAALYREHHNMVGRMEAPALVVVSPEDDRRAELRQLVAEFGLPAAVIAPDQVLEAIMGMVEVIVSWEEREQRREQEAEHQRVLRDRWSRYRRRRSEWESRREAWVAEHRRIWTTDEALRRKFEAEVEPPPAQPDEPEP